MNNNQFPWVLIPGMIGFAIGFFVQFRLKHHIDRDKVLQIQDMAELYPNSIPPKKIFNEDGLRLYRWFYVGIGLFMGSILFMALQQSVHR